MTSRAFPSRPTTPDPHGCSDEGTGWLGRCLGPVGIGVLDELASARDMSLYHLLVDIGVVHPDRMDLPRVASGAASTTFTWPAA